LRKLLKLLHKPLKPLHKSRKALHKPPKGKTISPKAYRKPPKGKSISLTQNRQVLREIPPFVGMTSRLTNEMLS
jgi:hypothetical protein